MIIKDVRVDVKKRAMENYERPLAISFVLKVRRGEGFYGNCLWTGLSFIIIMAVHRKIGS